MKLSLQRPMLQFNVPYDRIVFCCEARATVAVLYGGVQYSRVL